MEPGDDSSSNSFDPVCFPSFTLRSSHSPHGDPVEDVHEFFKDVWAKIRQAEDARLREESELWPQGMEAEVGIPGEDVTETSKRPRTTVNQKALKVTCELLKVFVSEAVHRAGMMAEIEGLQEINSSHLERIVSQLFHDF